MIPVWFHISEPEFKLSRLSIQIIPRPEIFMVMHGELSQNPVVYSWKAANFMSS